MSSEKIDCEECEDYPEIDYYNTTGFVNQRFGFGKKEFYKK